MSRVLALVPRGARYSRGTGISAVVLGLVPVAALAADQGGYFPTSWGWAALGLLLPANVWLAAGMPVRLSAEKAAFVASWLMLGLWIGLSALWSIDVPQTVLEVERVLVYVAACVTLTLFASDANTAQLLAGLLSAIGVVSLFSLATRVFPDVVRVHDQTATYRLAQPIGYWNGLSIFASLGILLAIGFAARARRVAARAAAAALLVPLFATFYFTFGRGGWIALAAGVVAVVAFDHRRVQLLTLIFALAPVAAAAVWISSRYRGLTHIQAPLAEATRDGHALALRLALLVLLAATITALLAVAADRFSAPLWLRRAFIASAVAIAAIVAITVVARQGGPVPTVQGALRAFKAQPLATVDLNQRLVNFSGNGRYDLWSLAWRDARAHPWLGSGAGSYERYFLQHQPATVSRVRDAHSLYLETLAELGPSGFLLLIAALGVPLLLVRRTQSPLASAAAGAYVAYLVHAASDWDWELSAVTLAALVCAGALVTSVQRPRHQRTLGLRARVAAVVLLVALGAFVSVGLAGNSAVSASDAARQDGDWSGAASEAQRAHRFMPWSPRPWEALGEAQLGAGLIADARASFRRAIAIDPQDWTLWAALARVTRGDERRRAVREVRVLYPRSSLATDGARGLRVGGQP